MMSRTLLRLLRAPLTITHLIIDRLFAPLYFALHGLQVQGSVYVRGLPTIRMATGGAIRIGANVKLFSRPTSNPLYLQSPCVFALIKPDARIEIGRDTAMSGTVLCAANRISIGERVLIGANCTLCDTDFHPLAPEARRINPTDGAVARPIIIGDDVFIGTQAIILKGTSIGAGSVVGARAVVSGQFPPRSIIAGNPAQVIKSLDEQR